MSAGLAGNNRMSLKSLSVKENSSCLVGLTLDGTKPETYSYLVPLLVSPVTTKAVAYRLKSSSFTAGMLIVRAVLAGPERSKFCGSMKYSFPLGMTSSGR